MNHYVIKWKRKGDPIWYSAAVRQGHTEEEARQAANSFKVYAEDVKLEHITYAETITDIDLGE